MIVFPNAKINIGLNVTERRKDGFHNIQTIFYPIPLCDVLEFVNSDSSESIFTNSGLKVDCKIEDNLIVKAFRLLQNDFNLPELKIHLHKIIPFGAGLGGGSADAAFMLKGLNNYYSLSLDNNQLAKYALKLGSDCAFFIKNLPAYAEGRGEILSDIDLFLVGKYILLVKPDIHISSKLAYQDVVPHFPELSLKETVTEPIKKWKEKITNDFEQSVFESYTELEEIKQKMYDSGALFSSMSGSGSTIFGIFESEPNIKKFNQYGFVWTKILDGI